MYYCLSCNSFFKNESIDKLEELEKLEDFDYSTLCPSQNCYSMGSIRKIDSDINEIIEFIKQLYEMNNAHEKTKPIKDIEVKENSIIIKFEGICMFNNMLMEMIRNGIKISYYDENCFGGNLITEINYTSKNNFIEGLNRLINIFKK